MDTYLEQGATLIRHVFPNLLVFLADETAGGFGKHRFRVAEHLVYHWPRVLVLANLFFLS